MKKIKLIISLLVVVMMIPFSVNAASGNISVTSSSTITLGNTVTVTVKLTSSSQIGSWDMSLSYDKNYLQLTSSTGEAGGVGMVNSSSGVTSKTYTFKFKTLKTGSTKVSVSSYDVYANDFTPMSISSSSKTINIKTQEEIEASYSKDNSLKALSVEGFELNQEFDKEILEYTVDVPEDTKEVKVNASKNDSTATVTGTGTYPVTAGTNTLEIVVRAQNGSEKTYKITVNVIDKNPIEVNIDGETLTVVKIKEDLTKPDLFEETTIKIGEFDIPAFYNEHLDYTLVGLKDNLGNIKLYIYDNGNYTLYNEIIFSNLTIIPVEKKEKIDGYTEFEEVVNGINTTVFKLSKNSRFSVFYGQNVETGEKTYYTYDSTDNTLIKFDTEVQDKILTLEEDKLLYSYLIIGLAGLIVVLFIIVITLLVKSKKRKTKKKIINENIITEEKKDIENKEAEKEEISELISNIEEEEEKKETKKEKKSKKKDISEDFDEL